MHPSIVVIGGYKCATTTLERTFNADKRHALYKQMPASVDTILFPFRDNAAVFPSAFFQDITDTRYAYSIFSPGGLYAPSDNATMNKLVLSTPAKVLFTFFKKRLALFEGALFLNSITRINSFNQTYGCAIDYVNPALQTFSIVVDGIPRKLIAFDSSNLASNFEAIKRAIFSAPRPDIQLLSCNVGSKKWYAPKYAEFMALVQQNLVPKARAAQIRDKATYYPKFPLDLLYENKPFRGVRSSLLVPELGRKPHPLQHWEILQPIRPPRSAESGRLVQNHRGDDRVRPFAGRHHLLF